MTVILRRIATADGDGLWSRADDHGQLLLRQLDGTNTKSAVLLFLPKTKSKSILKQPVCFVSSMLVLEGVGCGRCARCGRCGTFQFCSVRGPPVQSVVHVFMMAFTKAQQGQGHMDWTPGLRCEESAALVSTRQRPNVVSALANLR